VQLINQQESYEAHEALESALCAESSGIRDLYQSILQAAGVYLPIRRGYYPGAIKDSARCPKWLLRWPYTCRGIAVDRLLQDLAAAIAEVWHLGPENSSTFDPPLHKPISWKIQRTARQPAFLSAQQRGNQPAKPPDHKQHDYHYQLEGSLKLNIECRPNQRYSQAQNQQQY